MPDQVRIVETRFVPTDQTSGALQHIAAEAKKADEQLETVAAATSKVDHASEKLRRGVGREGAVSWFAGGEEPAGDGQNSKAEREMYQAQREELRLRRARTNQIRLDNQKDAVLHQGTSTVMQLMMASQNQYIGGVAGAAQAVESMGTTLVGIGGKGAKLGASMAELGGKAGLLAGAFGVGYAVGTTAIEALHEAGIKFKAFASDYDYFRTNNEEYAKASGYASKAHMEAAVQMTADADKKHRIEVAAMNLAGGMGALPSDAGGQEMASLSSRLAEKMNAAGVREDELKETHARALQVMEQSRETQLKRALDEIGLDEAIKKYGKDVKAVPVNATAYELRMNAIALSRQTQEIIESTKADVSRRNEILQRLEAEAQGNRSAAHAAEDREAKLTDAVNKRATELGRVKGGDDETFGPKLADVTAWNNRKAMLVSEIMATTGAQESERAQIDQMVAARANAIGSVENVVDAFRQSATEEMVYARAIHAAEKQVDKLRIPKTAEALVVFNETMVAAAHGVAAKLGVIDDPLKVKKILDDLKTHNLQREKRSFDFRGSRFDITQKFEEGFDPDRISAAMASDFADLGERSVQSAFGGLYSAAGG